MRKNKDIKFKSKKSRFANFIVIICISVSLLIAASVIYEYHRLNVVVPSSVLTIFYSFFGGELLILVLRQIFGQDIIAQAKTYKPKGQEEISVNNDSISFDNFNI